jgi:hypothetical protein
VEVLATIHQYTGYAVALVVLGSAVVAFGKAKDAREFTPGPYVLAAVLLDIQVLVGLVLYGGQQVWAMDEPSALLAYVHPAVAVLALVSAHVGIKRARGQRMAVDAHRAAGRGLVIALLLVLAAIASSSLANYTDLGT